MWLVVLRKRKERECAKGKNILSFVHFLFEKFVMIICQIVDFIEYDNYQL